MDQWRGLHSVCRDCGECSIEMSIETLEESLESSFTKQLANDLMSRCVRLARLVRGFSYDFVYD